MALPAGWHREYEGRHGAEYFYDRRNLTVSVLPRYERAYGRASQKEPVAYVVRVHRILDPEPSVPMTLGERETFAAAKELARRYMRRVDTRSLRAANEDAFAAFTDVASYDDDVLVDLCRSLARSPIDAVVHVDDGRVTVAHASNESPAAVRDRLTARTRQFSEFTDPGDSAWYLARATTDLVWVPRGGADGTLVEFADAHDDVGAFLDEVGSFVRRRDVEDDAQQA
ncbi:hypothetical protein [Halorubellus salinus]|uniref:hypothetical protein n=1 Tax=Halorubellus salinus TaxID=755309 RepID=UPI001D0824BD|nr:hypothetical protein [Halorubellus salinus]